MADQPAHRHVEVSADERVIASAQVTTSPGDPGTAQASLQAESGIYRWGAGRVWLMRSWTCPNCKAVPTWKRPCRSATPSLCNASKNAPTA
jgi:hypothetical protein